jgi:hypothetical protein
MNKFDWVHNQLQLNHGSFHNAMLWAWRKASPDNKARLEESFPEFFKFNLVMKPQEANKLIAEFMGYDKYNIGSIAPMQFDRSWDWLMPVIAKLKSIDPDWINEEAQHIIDAIDDALTCCWGIDEVHRYTVEAIMNYNEYKS